MKESIKKIWNVFSRQEDGFVLVFALLVMLVLTIIGIATTTNTSLELQIAGNDKVHKQTFYAAEAGAILGAEVLEQNLNCVTGFSTTLLENKVEIKTNLLAYNAYEDTKYEPGNIDDTVRGKFNVDAATNPHQSADFIYPDGATEQSYGYVVGATKLQAGGALMMAAGYERKGKSAAAGGVSILYDIYSRHEGLANSQSIVLFGWRHLVGNESACKY